MNIFERAIPFPQRLQWLMLKLALEEGLTAEVLAQRLDWKIEKVRQCLWGKPGKLKIDVVGEWFWACGGQMPRFTVEFKDERTRSNG